MHKSKHHHQAETPAHTASAESPSDKGHAKSQEAVRGHAYQKWEAAGRPNGDGVNFWLQAEREVLQTK
jgi:hypothetical protein